MNKFDRIIIGAGIFGLYAALKSSEKNLKVLIIEKENDIMKKASFVNQARLHNGYHYPRSLSTAKKSAMYFDRFFDDFRECINSNFDQIYAISSKYSWTNSIQFFNFCERAGIPIKEIDHKQFFDDKMIEKAFLTKEYSFDSLLIKEKLFKKLSNSNITLSLGKDIVSIKKNHSIFEIQLEDGFVYSSESIFNATYSGINHIHSLLGYDKLPLKYEFCEVDLCTVSSNINNVGITVMDGPFFSLMPFGKSSYHSLTSVSYTPHLTSYDEFPIFKSQNEKVDLNQLLLNNPINSHNPLFSSYSKMNQLLKIYTSDKVKTRFERSLFTIKPILLSSEIDDSRPTFIKKYSSNPDFFTIFSGKLNTIYDLDEVL